MFIFQTFLSLTRSHSNFPFCFSIMQGQDFVLGSHPPLFTGAITRTNPPQKKVVRYTTTTTNISITRIKALRRGDQFQLHSALNSSLPPGKTSIILHSWQGRELKPRKLQSQFAKRGEIRSKSYDSTSGLFCTPQGTRHFWTLTSKGREEIVGFSL